MNELSLNKSNFKFEFCNLTDIDIRRELHLFRFSVELEDLSQIIIDMRSILLFNLSKTLADMEGPYFIIELEMKKVLDGGKDLLTKLHYDCKDKQGNLIIYPGKTIYHLRLDGDISCDVVSVEFDLYRKQ